MNIKKIALAAALPLAMMVAAPAQAASSWQLIDDFNVATTTTVFSDNPSKPILAPGGTIADGTPGWTRQITATATPGDDPSFTQVCSNCSAGHYRSGAGGTGTGSWIYSGPAWDIAGDLDDPNITDWYFSFEYAADFSGAIVSFEFTDGTNSETFSSSVLEATGSGGIDTLTDARINWEMDSSPVDYEAITGIIIKVDGSNVQDLDFSIDNPMVHHVPEPATFALMGLGLAGLGWKKRRAVAK